MQVTIKQVRPDQGLMELIIPAKRKIYDERLHDYIGSVCIPDEEFFALLSKAGYTEEESMKLIERMWANKHIAPYGGTVYNNTELDKPITYIYK